MFEQNIYFLGIGGIGMSALARYFHNNGIRVAGYDRTRSAITDALQQDGISIVYDDNISEDYLLQLQDRFPVESTLVVRTPAVPDDQSIYTYFREHDYRIRKRAEVLGLVTQHKRALCVAGTHGKTTTSTILAHILYGSHLGCNAFLGGISCNYLSNLLIRPDSDLAVIEADEFDRSFWHLTPAMTVITAIDPDHLDIYGTPEAYQEGFDVYANKVQEAIVLKKGYHLHHPSAKVYTYSVSEQADFYADNILIEDGHLYFDLHLPDGATPLSKLELGVPVWVNIENSVAAAALAWLNGVGEKEIRHGLATYAGVQRRFNIHVNNPQVAYVDDYAHHPTELKNSIESVRKLFPHRYVIGVFQPHLFTRTRDFADEFAAVLSTVDELVLLPIYPAREQPIQGVSSQMLLSRTTCPNKHLVQKNDLVALIHDLVANHPSSVVLSLGAGDIDRLVPTIKQNLLQR